MTLVEIRALQLEHEGSDYDASVRALEIIACIHEGDTADERELTCACGSTDYSIIVINGEEFKSDLCKGCAKIILDNQKHLNPE